MQNKIELKLEKKLLLKLVLLSFVVFNIVPYSFGANSTLKFHSLTTKQGLSHNTIACITQDSAGFIWIGSRFGLQRYDGVKVQRFINTGNSTNRDVLNSIQTFQLNRNLLFIGTDAGLGVFDIEKQEYLNFGVVGEMPRVVEYLKVINDSTVVFSNATEGLFLVNFNLDNTSITVRNVNKICEDLPPQFNKSVNINDIKLLNGNIILVVTSRVLYAFKLDNANILKYLNNFYSFEDVPLKGYNISDVSIYKNNFFFLSSRNIQHYKGEVLNNKLSLNFVKEISLSEISAKTNSTGLASVSNLNELVIDGNLNGWVSTNKGLLRIKRILKNKPRVTLYKQSLNNKYSLNRNTIRDLFIDNTGVIWVGTYEGGINYANINPKRFEYLNTSEYPGAQENELVRSMHVNGNGDWLIGHASSGLLVLDRNRELKHRFSSFKNSNGWISAIEHIENDTYLVGRGVGLDIINTQNGVITELHNNNSQGFRFNRISDIVKDKNGFFWVSSKQHGIYRLKIEGNDILSGIRINDESKLKLSVSDVNSVLYNAESNEILAATHSGLNRIILDAEGNPVRKILYQSNKKNNRSLSSNYIWSVANVPGVINEYWLGTIGGGLNHIIFKDVESNSDIGAYEATAYTEVDGLPIIDVENVCVDAENNVWFTSTGIFYFDIDKEEFKRFDIFDGLEQEKYAAGSAYQSTDGTIFFGCENGVTHFNPKKIKINKFGASIVLSDLRIKNELVGVGQEVNGRELLNKRINDIDQLHLKYNENDFSISFSTAEYLNPDKHQYKFILEGFDSDWKKTGQQYPIANYSNLDYGSYIFKVYGTNSDGVWSAKPKRLEVIVNPPWYRSKLAKVVYILIAIILLVIAYIIVLRWLKIKNKLTLNEEMHQMKLRFFTNISHELRTPLTLILSPLEDLLSNKVPQNMRQEMYKMMYRNTKSLLRLINELMDFRKVETGVDKLKPTIVEFHTFVRAIAKQFETLASKKQMQYEINIPNSNTPIWLDSVKAEKIVLNLLSNAFKYTPDGGMVSISIIEQPQQFTFHKDKYDISITDAMLEGEDYVGIMVSDTGHGISKSSLPNIFNRFYQDENATSSQQHGSGVGLALVRSLVDLQNCFIKVASQKGAGTDFLVAFPLNKDKVNAHATDDSFEVESVTAEKFVSDDIDMLNTTESLSGESTFNTIRRDNTILIVEDNAEMRTFLQSKLEEEFEVKTAIDGVEAQEIMKEFIPDLIVSDYMMPNKDGLSFTKELKDDIETCHIPVILLTAKGSVNDKIAGAESGAEAYLTKPFSYDHLRAVVISQIENRKKLVEKFASDALFEAKELGQNKKDKEFFDKLYAFIEANMESSELDSDLICRELGIGRTTLFNKVKSLTEQSLGQFIRSIRLKTAAKLLIVDNYTISEAAFKVGITSPSYFSRAFKEQFGKTPREFVEQYSKE